jgi:hypothetical protein
MAGMEFLGKIEPTADNGSKHILVIVDTKLTVTAPSFMDCPENKYSTYSKLYSGAVTNYSHELVTEENIDDAIIQSTRWLLVFCLREDVKLGKWARDKMT